MKTNMKNLYDEKDKEKFEDNSNEDKSKNNIITREIKHYFNIEDSVVYLFEDINELVILDVIIRMRTIIANRKDNDDTPINLILNSDGGSVYDMFCLVDFIETFSVKVNIICRGRAMSAAAIILASGTGKRLISKRSAIMFHEISSLLVGKHKDLKAKTNHIDTLSAQACTLLASVTKKDYDWWQQKLQSDFYLTQYVLMNTQSHVFKKKLRKILIKQMSGSTRELL